MGRLSNNALANSSCNNSWLLFFSFFLKFSTQYQDKFLTPIGLNVTSTALWLLYHNISDTNHANFISSNDYQHYSTGKSSHSHPNVYTADQVAFLITAHFGLFTIQMLAFHELLNIFILKIIYYQYIGFVEMTFHEKATLDII